MPADGATSQNVLIRLNPMTTPPGPPLPGPWTYGWQIPSSASVGLTGVPRVTDLTYASRSRPLVGVGGLDVYTGAFNAGMTIDGASSPQGHGYYINNAVFRANMTFKRCWLTNGVGTGISNAIDGEPVGSTLNFVDCEVTRDPGHDLPCSCYSFGLVCFYAAVVNMTRVWMHDVGAGGRISNGGLVSNCWLDNLIGSPFGQCGESLNSHNDCWFRQDDSGPMVTVDACYMRIPGPNLVAGAEPQTNLNMFIQSNGAPVANMRITNNLFDSTGGNPNGSTGMDDRWGGTGNGQSSSGVGDGTTGIANIGCDNNRYVDTSAQGIPYIVSNWHVNQGIGRPNGGNATWTTNGNFATNNYVYNPTDPSGMARGALITPGGRG